MSHAWGLHFRRTLALMDILAGTLVDILAEEKLVTCKTSMDILAEFFHR